MSKPGNSPYTIEYLEKVTKHDIPDLPHSVRPLIKRAIENRLTIDPIGFGKPLRYSLKGHRRIRISDYRVIYRIDVTLHMVIIVAIKHRKKIYDDA